MGEGGIVIVGVRVAVGVLLGVGVIDGVIVIVGVKVGVAVGGIVGDGVKVCVGVGLGPGVLEGVSAATVAPMSIAEVGGSVAVNSEVGSKPGPELTCTLLVPKTISTCCSRPPNNG